MLLLYKKNMLRITVGPMYSGKTSLLMEEYKNCDGKKVIIDYDIHNKDSYIINHDSNVLPCINAVLLQKVNDINEYDYIFINEAQFFKDLKKFVLQYPEKYIYLYGLDGDYQRKPFGQLLELIPHCNSVIKLTAQCKCGKPATCTTRVSSEKEQYVPNATYIATCCGCYY